MMCNIEILFFPHNTYQEFLLYYFPFLPKDCLFFKNGWENNAIKKRTKWTILGIPPISGVIFAVAPLIFGVRDRACSLKQHPLDCDDPYSEVECTHGDYASSISRCFMATMLIAIMTFVIILSSPQCFDFFCVVMAFSLLLIEPN